MCMADSKLLHRTCRKVLPWSVVLFVVFYFFVLFCHFVLLLRLVVGGCLEDCDGSAEYIRVFRE